jgi:hypothetical protein
MLNNFNMRAFHSMAKQTWHWSMYFLFRFIQWRQGLLRPMFCNYDYLLPLMRKTLLLHLIRIWIWFEKQKYAHPSWTDVILNYDATFSLRYQCGECFPHVEAGKDTSTVILVIRKRRRKRNPVVSDDTVMYGYESSATMATDRLHYKLQTHPLVREGAPRRRVKQFSGKRMEKVKSGHGPQMDARHQDILTDWS